MKQIALISDTHHIIDKRFIPHLKKADEIWHAGDIGAIKTINTLKQYAPVRAVHGNIDGNEIRLEFKSILYFKCEKINVIMTHIGGYPGNYKNKIQQIITQNKPDLFICGHSHILKVIYDKKNNLLHMNPGAIGNYGSHKVKTMLFFTIKSQQINELKVIEFPR